MHILNKNIIWFLCLMLFSTSALFAQNTENDDTTDLTGRVPTDTGRQILREMVILSFEDSSNWKVRIPEDRGKTTIRRIIGGPSAKPEVVIEDQLLKDQIQILDSTDEYVLGVKTEFYGRSETTIEIDLYRSVFVPGVVKKVSLWVLGRNKRHQLLVVFRGMDGDIKRLSLGNLDFRGWKKLEVNIPLDIKQESFGGGFYSGFYLLGFEIDTYFEDTVGSFYTYFDDLRIIRDAILDLVYTAEDEISDSW